MVKARLTPATAAAASTRSLRSPTAAVAPPLPPVATLPRTGVGTTMMISATPATCAGTAFMIRLDG